MRFVRLFPFLIVSTLLSPSLFSAPATPASTYILRSRDIKAAKIAIDANGNTYVAGSVNGDGFVTKLDADLRQIYTVTLGGESGATVNGLAIGPTGDIYVAGETGSADFPVIQAAQTSRRGRSDGFLVRLTPNGGIVYSTYFGGANDDSISAVAVDAAGSAYVTGTTSSQDFPVTSGAFQKTMTGPNPFAAPTSGFVAKFAADGKIAYATFLGGTKVSCTGGSSCIPAVSSSAGTSIAVDASGAAYIGGSTNSFDFPVTPGAFQGTCLCSFRSSDAFVTKLNADGSALVFSTFIPAGTPQLFAGDTVSALAIDATGNVFATGTTGSTTFPTTPGAMQKTFQSQGTQVAVFALKLAAAGDQLLYSTLLTDGIATVAGIQLDQQGSVLLAGRTNSPAPAATAGANTSGENYFLKLNPLGTALTYVARLPNGSADSGIALSPTLDVLLLGSTGFVSRTPSTDNGFRAPTILGVANAAGLSVNASVAAGEIISIYGTAVGPAQNTGARLDSSGRVATELAGVRVLINGTPVPLTFAGPNQINAVMPLALIASQPADLQVTRDGQTTVAIGLWARDIVPEVFRTATIAPGSLTRFAAALNEDGSINSEANPAKPGSIVAIFVTGMGRMNGSLADGEVASTVLPKPVAPIKVSASEIVYLGQAPSLIAGAVQINFRMPLVPGSTSIVLNLESGGKLISPFAIAVSR